MVERYKGKGNGNGKKGGEVVPFVPKKNKQGELPHKGRKRGSPNKYNKEMRDAILAAAAKVGLDGKGRDGWEGFLELCARSSPLEYLKCMVKLVPHKLYAQVEHTFTFDPAAYESLDDARDALEKEGIVIDQVLQ